MAFFITGSTFPFLIVNNEADTGGSGQTKCRKAQSRSLLFGLYFVYLQFAFELQRERNTEYHLWRKIVPSVYDNITGTCIQRCLFRPLYT